MVTRWMLWALLVVHVLDPLQGSYIRMKSVDQLLELSCNANESLTHCTVLHDTRRTDVPASSVFPKLSQGQCGVRLDASLTSVASATISCSDLEERSVSNTSQTALSLIIESSNASSVMTAVAGKSLQLPCGVDNVDNPISYCFFQVPTLGVLDLSLGEYLAPSTTHAFTGLLRFGRCALTLLDVNPKHSGRIRCLKQIRGSIYLHTIQLRVRAAPLGGGVIGGIVIAVILLILVAVIIWLWRINRLPCQLAIANIPNRIRSAVRRRRAGKESGIYDEIDLRPYRPKTPPRPHQFESDIPDGYIIPNPLTIRKPEVDRKVVDLNQRMVSDLPCVRYDLMPGHKPLVPRDAVVKLDRPASYMDMRVDREKEEPKYLSLIDITEEGEKCEPAPVQDPMYFNMSAGVSAVRPGKNEALPTNDAEYLKMTAGACANPADDPDYLKMSGVKSSSKVPLADDPDYLRMSGVKSSSKVPLADEPDYLKMSEVKKKPNVKPRKFVDGNVAADAGDKEEDDHPMFSD